MLFLEPHARSLLMLHAVVGAATVAAATHLVIWTRTWWRGDYRRVAGARWLAAAGFALYAAQFAIGNLIYPVYKVRVRAEYFDEPAAIRAEAQLRAEARAQTARRWGPSGADAPAGAAAPAPPARPRDLSFLGRLFDVKEHWVALGLALSAAAFALAWRWDPARDGREPTGRWGGRLLVLCAIGAAGCAWVGGLVGLYVASFRPIG